MFPRVLINTMIVKTIISWKPLSCEFTYKVISTAIILHTYFSLLTLSVHWHNVLQTINGFFIILISNGSRLYLFTHCSNVFRRFSIFVLESSFCLSGRAEASDYSPIVLTSTEASTVAFSESTGSCILLFYCSSKWYLSWFEEDIVPLLFLSVFT